MFNKLSIVCTLAADIYFGAHYSINHCLIFCMSHDRAVVYTVDFYVSNPSSYHALATFLHLSFFMNIKEIYEFIRCTCNHFDLGGKKSYNLHCFKLDFFTTISKQVIAAYTKLQIIHIVIDVLIRVRGTRGKHLSGLLVSVYFCL